MIGNKKNILEKIKKIKSETFGNIEIDCVFDDLKYNLVLITKECINNKKIVKLLYLWRKKNEFWFQSQFNITIDGTKKWLEERVINAPDRLLFMIRVKNRYIGHVGLFRFSFKENICEIDNIIRGVGLYPGIMESAIKHLMKWGKNILLLNSYTLETSSDNIKAINLYSKLGFIETKRIPLIRNNDKGYNEWVFAPKNYCEDVERYQVYMKLVNN